MTLTTHIIIAGAVTKPLASFNPAFSFFAALASHYLSDAIPHWDYKVSGMEVDDLANNQLTSPQTLIRKGLPYILLDLFIGTLILYIFFQPHTPSEVIRFALTVLGGILPDALQGPYYFLKRFGRERWLRPIQKFHDLMHTKIKLGAYPRFGIPFQILIFLIFIAFL